MTDTPGSTEAVPEGAGPPAFTTPEWAGVERELDPAFVPWKRQAGWISTATSAVVWGTIALVLHLILDRSSDSSWGTVLLSMWVAYVVPKGVWAQRRPTLDFRHTRYRVDDDGIEIRRGIWYRSITTIPKSRVQHTDVSQGPLERRYGLGTLTVHTAGDSNAAVALPGIAHADAIRIRDWLLPHTARHVG